MNHSIYIYFIVFFVIAFSCTSKKIEKRDRHSPLEAEEPIPPIDDKRSPTTHNEDQKEEPVKIEVNYKSYSGELDTEKVLNWVNKHQDINKDDNIYRYVYIPNQFFTDKESLNRARIGFSKGINQVAVEADSIIHPTDISDGHGLVFALPINKLWGKDAIRKWEYTAAAEAPERPSGATHAKDYDLASFEKNQPVAADRLVYNMLHGKIYNELINFPVGHTTAILTAGGSSAEQLKQSLNLSNNPDARIGTQNAITYGPRYIQRFEIPGYPGALWESHDDFYGVKQALPWLDGSLPQFRSNGMLDDHKALASETWYHMKNGLPAYFLFGNVNQERSFAPRSVVEDPLNHHDKILVNGFCVFCHISGVQSAPNDMWIAIENGTLTNNISEAKAFWSENKKIEEYYVKDRKIITNALTEIVHNISDGNEKFQNNIIHGIDGKEPCYYLTQYIRKGTLGGQTDGYRRRNPDGSIGVQ